MFTGVCRAMRVGEVRVLGHVAGGAVLLLPACKFGEGEQTPEGAVDSGIGASVLAEQDVAGLGIPVDEFEELQGVVLFGAVNVSLAVEPCQHEYPVIGLLQRQKLYVLEY